MENIADAVTHARFVGTDQASDGVVLMKIVQVLRTLMLNPEGSALSNESVCEVMLSCFRLCFEPRLNELLRRTAEHALRDIVLLLFMRLPQFAEEGNASGLVRKLKMMAGSIEQTGKKSRATRKPKVVVSRTASMRKASVTSQQDDDTSSTISQLNTPSTASSLHAPKVAVLATTPATPSGGIIDMQGKMMQTPTSSTANVNEEVMVVSPPPADDGGDLGTGASMTDDVTATTLITDETLLLRQTSVENDADVEDDAEDSAKYAESGTKKVGDFVNSMGVRFTPVSENGEWK